MGEGETPRAAAAVPQAAHTPAPAPASVPAPTPRPTAGGIWPPYTGRTATPGRTVTRRCVPKVGTSIQRSGDRGARKLIELALPPPPPPPKPRARPYLRPTAKATTARPPAPPPPRPRHQPATSTTTTKTPTQPHLRPTTKAATVQPPAPRPPRPQDQPRIRPSATTAGAVTDAPPPPPRLRVTSNQPFRGRVVIAAPIITIGDDDDPLPQAAAGTAPGHRPEQQMTRTLTVAPGVHLDIPLTAIYQRRYFRAKAGNGRWTLRFDDQGRLRSAFKK